jgi:pimeloyl-ACP methyl ester carboxylesterase
MIAQELAIKHPDRVRSLCSIMSNTGSRSVGQPSASAVAALLQPPPKGRDEAIEFGLGIWRVIGSPAYPSDPDLERERIGAAYDRSHDPDGVARQAAAIITAEDRTDGLKGVRVPTLVIHGDSDLLVDVSGGIATAAAIPDAQLLVIEGMGHDLPVQLYDRLVDAILAHVVAAEASPQGKAR